MFNWVIAVVMGMTGTSHAEECASRAGPDDYHLLDICQTAFQEGAIYTATVSASMTARPASQQVAIYRFDDRWYIRIAGFRSEEGVVTTRRRELPIPDSDVERIAGLMNDDVLRQLAALPFYGSDDMICLDGSTLAVMKIEHGRRLRGSQHSCAGRTDINVLAGEFRALALKHDPEFAGSLSGLSN